MRPQYHDPAQSATKKPPETARNPANRPENRWSDPQKGLWDSGNRAPDLVQWAHPLAGGTPSACEERRADISDYWKMVIATLNRVSVEGSEEEQEETYRIIQQIEETQAQRYGTPETPLAKA